jgi:hypothetical protein
VNYKAMVPKPISQEIGRFGLERDLLVRLVAAIHADIPRDYERSRRFRTGDSDRAYRYRIALHDEQWRHVFRLAVDDTTGQGFLIVIGIRHDKRRRPPQA